MVLYLDIFVGPFVGVVVVNVVLVVVVVVKVSMISIEHMIYWK